MNLCRARGRAAAVQLPCRSGFTGFFRDGGGALRHVSRLRQVDTLRYAA